MNNEIRIEIKTKMSTYEKNKEAIYKWRNKNRDEWLLKQHEYFANKMMDPDKKQEHYDRLKSNKLKREENMVKNKVGRPSKYPKPLNKEV